MLASVDSLNQQLLALPPVDTPTAGATQFVNCIADYMDRLQAGPTGSPGIFTFLRPAAIAAIMALPPVKDNSWITNFANAIHLGATGATLTSGTVVNPTWTASGVDVLPVVNTGLSAALATLISGLQPITSENNPAMPMAQAINGYAKSFTFLCTGLVAASSGPPTPLPLTFSAE